MADLVALQPKLYETFTHILQTNRLHHAYLFSGGFGSLEMALFLAQSRFCDNLLDSIPCGECRSCRLIAKQEFSDVKMISPVGQTIKTDVIRQLVQEFSQSGYEGETQVFIIQDCEKLHPNAANSLLKVIEEPQSDTYIFLLTSDENKVLPTIKSRTQIFHFVKNKELLQYQAEQSGLLKKQAELLADLAETPADLEKLAQDSQLLELMQLCQRFVDLLFKDRWQAYLEVSRLALVAKEQVEQDMAFQMISILLSKQLSSAKTRLLLERVYRSHQMWKHRVSFQNAMEYMVLS